MKSNIVADKIIAYKFQLHLFEARTLLCIYFDQTYECFAVPS